MGYHRAGFDEIIGIDNRPQPNYPFTFILADATQPPVRLDAFDLIHASPPCQAYSSLRHQQIHNYPELIPVVRRALAGQPHWVIENVVGAKQSLVNPIKLCGSHFNLHLNDGSELRRHRLFETSFPVPEPPCNHQGLVLGVYGRLERIRRLSNVNRRPKGDRKASKDEARELMQIDWMTDKELVEAIPPAYTEYIGREFLRSVELEEVLGDDTEPGFDHEKPLTWFPRCG